MKPKFHGGVLWTDHLSSAEETASRFARQWAKKNEVVGLFRLDADLKRGVVALTHGWGNAKTPGMRVAHNTPGANQNVLLPSGAGSFDPLSNQAFMTGIPVEVEPA